MPLTRVWLVAAVFGFCFLVLFAYSFKLQVIDHEKYAQMARTRHVHKVKLRSNRGPIYDRNSEPLAVTIETDSIYVRPAKVKQARPTAQRVAYALGLEESYVLKKFGSDKPFVWIKRQVPPEESALLRELDLPGIGMVKEADRGYPLGRLGASVLGYTGVDLQGLAGLEVFYEKQLAGEGGTLTGERDALGTKLYPDGILFEGTRQGYSLQLTLDANIQFFADSALAEAFVATGAKGACAIVMDPYTGEVLAMASQPSFNPNLAYAYQRNIAVTDIFEPGSTFKPFAMAAAIDTGQVSLDEKIFCHNGKLLFGGHKIHDTHEYASLTPTEIIQKSSNIGIAQIANRMGRQSWYKAMVRFGFGTRTGIDFADEPQGIVRDSDKWRKIDIATTAFGQGVGVTPIQMATAFCALVNGGNLMKPYLASEVFDEKEKTLVRTNPQIVRRVISREASRIISQMMATVTQPGGTGTRAAIEGYTVAGKTGTAQKPEAGRYSLDKRVASFIGAVPAENPEIVILVLIDEPKGSPSQKYGGVCAAPVFAKIAESTLRHRRRFEKDGIGRKEVQIDLVKLNPARTMELKESNYDRQVDENRMPDLLGMSMRNVLRIAQQQNLDITVLGSGVAVRQSPQAGDALSKERHGRVLFRPAS